MPPKQQDQHYPLARVEIDWDGMQVSVAALDGSKVTHSWVHGRPTSVAGVHIGWGGLLGTGAVSRIGKKSVNYKWFGGGVSNVTGNDPQVDVYVRERPHHQREDNRQRQ